MGPPTCHPHDSLTEVTSFRGKHLWMIKNWKSWVGCSEKPVVIQSDIFSIPIVNDEGNQELTTWMIKAFPKRYAQENKDMLAFRLVCLSKHVPKGSFHFETVTPSILGGHSPTNKFKPLPLDAAYHWMTFIRYHPGKDLIMKVKINIVVPNAMRKIQCGVARDIPCKTLQMANQCLRKRNTEQRRKEVHPGSMRSTQGLVAKGIDIWKNHLLSHLESRKNSF